MVKLTVPLRDASPWYTSALLIGIGLLIAAILVLLDMTWALVIGVFAAFVFGAAIAHRWRRRF